MGGHRAYWRIRTIEGREYVVYGMYGYEKPRITNGKGVTVGGDANVTLLSFMNGDGIDVITFMAQHVISIEEMEIDDDLKNLQSIHEYDLKVALKEKRDFPTIINND